MRRRIPSTHLDRDLKRLRRLVLFLTILLSVLLMALAKPQAKGDVLHALADLERHHALVGELHEQRPGAGYAVLLPGTGNQERNAVGILKHRWCHDLRHLHDNDIHDHDGRHLEFDYARLVVWSGRERRSRSRGC